MKWKVYDLEANQRKRGERWWKDCRTRQLNKKDAIDPSEWKN